MRSRDTDRSVLSAFRPNRHGNGPRCRKIGRRMAYALGDLDVWREARVSDAPRANEIVVAVAVTASGRPLPRIGGLQVSEIKGEDGLR